MNVTFATDQSTVETTVFEPTTDSGPLPPVPRGDALGYVPVETGIDDEAVRSVGLAVDVDAQAVPDNRSRDSVVVYRYTNEGWSALPTRYDSSAGRYLATADGLSSLAVASLEPGQVRVVNTTSPPDWARQGYQTNVTATVENPGDRPAQRTLTVTVDGRPVANETVRLDPGERDEVTIGFPAGGGTVAVEGTEAGQMNVSEGNQWDNDPPSGLSAGDGPGFDLGLVALLFVALVLVGSVERLRRLRR
ncbi:hypothetical protein NDI85_12850 [Halomicroarcula sp. S1AR25-4]|uniref:DUF7407 domain-containing protein n=1 Tax=Haloarcula sp. S1AR25-4 TaxID=2950538 RepID=UPI0028758182|nr:CARDB domain-containing protein [Halomicroarcula sp. S1AR25-4]MDS0278688.1 hypothetical protein [Halomicroarcula sp. S1AR25-4]